MPIARSRLLAMRRCQTLTLAIASLLAVACSDERPTEPGGHRRGAQLSEAVVAGLIHDDFTDTDGTLLTSHVPDGGGEPFSWLSTVWLDGGEEEAVIQENAVSATRGGNWVYVTSVGTGDRVELAFEVFREVTDAQDIAMFLRTAEGGFQDGISVLWGIGPTSNFIQVDALPHVFFQMPAPLSQGLHTFRTEIIGSRLDVYVDGNRVVSESVTLPAARRTAIALFRNAAPDVRITSFTAGPVGPPPPPERKLQVTCNPEFRHPRRAGDLYSTAEH